MHYISWYDVAFVYIILHFVLSRRLRHVTRVSAFWCIELSTARPQATQVLPTCSHSVLLFFMCRYFLSTHLPSWKRFRASYNCHIRRPFSISATVVVPLVIWPVQQPRETRGAVAKLWPFLFVSQSIELHSGHPPSISWYWSITTKGSCRPSHLLGDV